MTLNRSKKYTNNLQKISTAVESNKSNIFPIDEAVKLLLSMEQPNFKTGATVEIHFKLAIVTTKSDQLVRSSVILPHGTGKEVKIAAFVNPENLDNIKKLGLFKYGSEDLIEEIKLSGKIDFDIAIAQPDMMKKLPAIARVLGTAGVMPNPKTGTVGDNIEEMVKLIKSGKLDYRNDKSGNIHFSVGKTVFDANQLIENIQSAVDSVEKAKPEVIKKKYITSIHLASTMSPAIRIR
jgi:large subunit ribosomal protein L1